jgi:hypothetical protein
MVSIHSTRVGTALAIQVLLLSATSVSGLAVTRAIIGAQAGDISSAAIEQNSGVYT